MASKLVEIDPSCRYVENGSLAQMVKKYGRFPESLSKTYVRKVLNGLVYLHEQGMDVTCGGGPEIGS